MRMILVLGVAWLVAASAFAQQLDGTEGPYGTGNNGNCVSRPGMSCPTGRQTRQGPSNRTAPVLPPVGGGPGGLADPSEGPYGTGNNGWCVSRPGMSCPTGKQARGLSGGPAPNPPPNQRSGAMTLVAGSVERCTARWQRPNDWIAFQSGFGQNVPFVSTCTPYPDQPLSLATMTDVANAVFDGYRLHGGVLLPILIGRVATPSGGRARYFVALSGTETSKDGVGQSTFIGEDLMNGLSINIAGARLNEDAYSKFIWAALAAYRGRSGVPTGSELVLAGHSLGGMAAQNLAADSRFAGRWPPIRVLTMGSPKTAFLPNVPSRLFATNLDPIPWLSWLSVVGQFQLIRVDAGLNGAYPLNPIDYHMAYPKSTDFPRFTAYGDRI